MKNQFLILFLKHCLELLFLKIFLNFHFLRLNFSTFVVLLSISTSSAFTGTAVNNIQAAKTVDSILLNFLIKQSPFICILALIWIEHCSTAMLFHIRGYRANTYIFLDCKGGFICMYIQIKEDILCAVYKYIV